MAEIEKAGDLVQHESFAERRKLVHKHRDVQGPRPVAVCGLARIGAAFLLQRIKHSPSFGKASPPSCGNPPARGGFAAGRRTRSDERRVGKGWCSTCKSGWAT